MTLARVAGKKLVHEMASEELVRLRAGAARTVVDVGTGDGRFAYALAGEHPDWLVIGFDALDEPMAETAYRASRRPSRGGRANLVLLRVSIESLPGELAGIADHVFVLLPWGRLLEGIVLADDAVTRGLAALAKPGAAVSITLNGEIWADALPSRFAHLPVPNPEYVERVVAPGLARAGIDVTSARWLSATEAQALHTTWARRLGHGRAHPKFLCIEGTRRRPSEAPPA